MPEALRGGFAGGEVWATEELGRKGQKSELLGAVSGNWHRKHVKRPMASEQSWSRSSGPHTDHGAREARPAHRQVCHTVSALGSAVSLQVLLI